LECNRLRKKLLQNLKTASEDGQQVREVAIEGGLASLI
jgi:hypothetical protein